MQMSVESRIETTTHVARVGAPMTAPVDDEIVILSLASNHYVGLDQIGRRVWELLETPSRVDELCRRLANEFSTAPDQILGDLLPFLNDLKKEGLVDVAEK
jgi:hypothetical protein